MKNYFKENKLNDTQKSILKEFISTFLPKRGNKRKNGTNELEYLSATLDKVFIQTIGFNLSRQNVLDAFEELGYDIFTKNGEWDPDNKIYKPSIKGKTFRGGDGYDGYDASFIYVDVEQPVVRQLMLATFTPSSNTGQEKLQRTEEMKKKLGTFKLLVQGKYINASLHTQDGNV